MRINYNFKPSSINICLVSGLAQDLTSFHDKEAIEERKKDYINYSINFLKSMTVWKETGVIE